MIACLPCLVCLSFTPYPQEIAIELMMAVRQCINTKMRNVGLITPVYENRIVAINRFTCLLNIFVHFKLIYKLVVFCFLFELATL